MASTPRNPDIYLYSKPQTRKVGRKKGAKPKYQPTPKDVERSQSFRKRA